MLHTCRHIYDRATCKFWFDSGSRRSFSTETLVPWAPLVYPYSFLRTRF